MKILSNKEYSDLLKQEKYYKDSLKDLDKLRNELENKEHGLDQETNRIRKNMAEDFELKEKKLVAAYEDKLSKSINELKQKHMEELNELRTKLESENHSKLQKMMEDNYQKLSESMTKLHEEGNATTKHMSNMTTEVLRAAGLQGASTMSVKRIENVDN